MADPALLISIDGMRPDAIAQAKTPCFDQLMETGAYSLKAQTVMPSVTLPCHTSMHRGVDVPRHGITTNVFQPLARPVPSLFDAAFGASLITAMFFNWGELRDLMEATAPTYSFLFNDPSTPESDKIVAKAAMDRLLTTKIDLTFLYLGYTDTSGHEFGWMSDEYIQAIERADVLVSQVLDAYAERGARPNLLLLSDHGGHERTHGTTMPEDMTIPWIMNGPAIRSGVELETPPRIFDACPTIAHLAGVPQQKHWEGRIVSEAFV